MRKILFILLITIAVSSCKTKGIDPTSQTQFIDSTHITNNFYDDAKVFDLPLSKIKITGEIENPGFVDFSKLPTKSIIVKETLLGEKNENFRGAFKYEGYSLLDILDQTKVKKKNRKEFKPIIDLYIEIENDKGEKINISWGEIYYPNHLGEIIIANKVMRIIPVKTGEKWELPEQSKVIVLSDLITERNILNPTKITVKSYSKSFNTIKGLKPLYSEKIDIYNDLKLVNSICQNPNDLQNEKYNTIFYGHGRGLHSTKPSTGVLLKNVFAKNFNLTKKNIQRGIFAVVAKDGYRGVFSFSEIMNRNDQSEILLLCNPEKRHNGIFRLIPACDFFSDRAIKGISEIYFSCD